MSLRVGAISPVSSYGGVSSVRQLSYSIDNEAETSDAFNESVNFNTDSSINSVNPVSYPNAESTETKSVTPVMNRQEMEKSYNDMAEQFADVTTGYSSQGVGQTYGVVGQNFDTYI